MQKFIIIGRQEEYRNPWVKIACDEVSLSKMKQTWQFIKEYRHWFLATPKAKHDFTTEHFVLRERNSDISNTKKEELYNLIEEFSASWYTCRRNAVSLQTVPWIVHYHIAKFKNMDKEVEKISK